MTKNNNTVTGGVLLTLASLIYLIAGYGATLFLARKLGPEQYGRYGVIISVMTLINLMQTSGLPQAVSKYSQHFQNRGGNCTPSVEAQLMLTIVLSIGLALMAPVLASLLNGQN